MLDQKESELTSSQGHTKITIIYRTTIDKNNLKSSKTDFPQLGYTEGTKMRCVEEMEMRYSLDSHLWIGYL